MHYVYILKSQTADKIYVGESGETPERRTIQHNQGSTVYTRKFRPWVLKSYIVLNTRSEALKLETYLKTGAGRAFISKYLLEELQQANPADDIS